MTKFLIALSISIIIFIYFNYPFRSEGISIVIVFICLAVITFSGVKIWSERNLKEETYESAEKEITRRHNQNGKFRYDIEGFQFMKNNKTEFIKWDDITEVNSFTIPTGRWTQQSGLEVITKNRNYEFNSANTVGIDKLGDQLYENLPDWNLNAEFFRVNNYGVEKANLYKKNSIG